MSFFGFSHGGHEGGAVECREAGKVFLEGFLRFFTPEGTDILDEISLWTRKGNACRI